MKLLTATFVILFFGFCSRNVQKDPSCLFESTICLGSTLEEVQSVFPDMIPQGEKDYYQFALLEQEYSRDKTSKADRLSRGFHLRFDEDNILEKFAVVIIDFRSHMGLPKDYWKEVVKAFGADQLRYYRVENLEWERPYQYSDSIVDPSGVKIVHEFNKSDIVLLKISVNREE